jgi:hypothetical protein
MYLPLIPVSLLCVSTGLVHCSHPFASAHKSDSLFLTSGEDKDAQMMHVMALSPGSALYENVEVDDGGLSALLLYLKLTQESLPGAKKHNVNYAFELSVIDEIASCESYMAALEQHTEPHGFRGNEFPLPLDTKDLFEPWLPAQAIDRWGFVVVAFCTPSHRALAERLRDSLQRFGLPYSFQETPMVHVSLSPNASTDLRYTKPNFIQKMMDDLNTPVLYLDVDLVVMSEPVHIEEAIRNKADWATTNLLADEISSCWLPAERRFPAVKGTDGFEEMRYFVQVGDVKYFSKDQAQTNGAVQFVNNTKQARQMLECWHHAIDFHCAAVCLPSSCDPTKGKGYYTFAEDHILDWVWNNRKSLYDGVLANVKPYWLPVNYARLPIHIFAAPIINHPDFGSMGPRVRIAAHKGVRKVHLDITTPRKHRRSLDACGIPYASSSKLKSRSDAGAPSDSQLAVDIIGRQVGYFHANSGFAAASDLEAGCWPPAMTQWSERFQNPWAKSSD